MLLSTETVQISVHISLTDAGQAIIIKLSKETDQISIEAYFAFVGLRVGGGVGFLLVGWAVVGLTVKGFPVVGALEGTFVGLVDGALVVGLIVVGALVGLADGVLVVGLSVVGLSVVGLSVLGLAVVGLAVLGLDEGLLVVRK